MKKLDYHFHSHFSADSEELPRNHVIEAIAHGLEEICFTEHRDFYFPGMDFSLNLPEYFQEINQLQAEFKDKIKIKIGLEMGIDLRFKSEINQFIDSAPFDFVIASVHEIGDIEVYDGTEFYLQKTKEEAQREYLLACLDVVQNFETYNSFGHLDYVARYGPYTDKSIKFAENREILFEILRALASKEKALEINTRLFDDPKTEQFYSDLLINFKELGGKFITLGTDSHIAKRDWLSIRKARNLIKRAGFHELATFSGMEIDKNKKSIKE